MIFITDKISISEDDLEESFMRSGGPGGQNVNKVNTAVQLRFNLRGHPDLPQDLKERAEKLAGRRLTKEGVIVISAVQYRTQEQNRADARSRLVELLQKAAIKPVPRIKTKPSYGARQRRLDSKIRHSHIKKMRGKPKLED